MREVVNKRIPSILMNIRVFSEIEPWIKERMALESLVCPFRYEVNEWIYGCGDLSLILMEIVLRVE
jgi:hypothetical protein